MVIRMKNYLMEKMFNLKIKILSWKKANYFVSIQLVYFERGDIFNESRASQNRSAEHFQLKYSDKHL